MCLFEVQISSMSISRKKSQLAYHHGWKLLGPLHTVSTRPKHWLKQQLPEFRALEVNKTGVGKAMCPRCKRLLH